MISNMMPKMVSIALLGAVLSTAAWSDVNVYSSRQEALIKPLLDKFTEQTGIAVNLVSGSDDALITRLQQEGARSPADLLITVDAGRLYRAAEAGVLQPIDSEKVNAAVPAYLRDANDLWTGLTMRARPIFYVKEHVNPADLSTYEALSDDQWKGRICIRSSSNIYNQSLMASMIETQGVEAAQAFANGIVKNLARPPAGGDTDQLRAAASGVCDIAIANTYYFGRLINSTDAADNEVAEKLAIFWPNQADRGTHINVSGVGLTKAAKNRDEAKQLIEFMVTAESQQWYAEVNNEYPVVEGVAIAPALAQWGEFKSDQVNLTALGKNNREGVMIMDRAGWK